uniref:Putative secreted protein n=1 Tax=Anopheles darlingi TaxID=43151 RepID=A0A2M4D3H6_ANODA
MIAAAKVLLLVLLLLLVIVGRAPTIVGRRFGVARGGLCRVVTHQWHAGPEAQQHGLVAGLIDLPARRKPPEGRPLRCAVGRRFLWEDVRQPVTSGRVPVGGRTRETNATVTACRSAQLRFLVGARWEADTGGSARQLLLLLLLQPTLLGDDFVDFAQLFHVPLVVVRYRRNRFDLQGKVARGGGGGAGATFKFRCRRWSNARCRRLMVDFLFHCIIALLPPRGLLGPPFECRCRRFGSSTCCAILLDVAGGCEFCRNRRSSPVPEIPASPDGRYYLHRRPS